MVEWCLPTALGFPRLVVDNAANMTKAARLLECGFHVGYLRRIVSFFHRSSVATTVLKAKAELLALPSHKLKMDVSTRWNSAYDMPSRYLEMQTAIIATLRSKELGRMREKDVGSLTDDEHLLAEEVAVCLKPLKDITTMLCTAASPTVSIIMPLFH